MVWPPSSRLFWLKRLHFSVCWLQELRDGFLSISYPFSKDGLERFKVSCQGSVVIPRTRPPSTSRLTVIRSTSASGPDQSWTSGSWERGIGGNEGRGTRNPLESGDITPRRGPKGTRGEVGKRRVEEREVRWEEWTNETKSGETVSVLVRTVVPRSGFFNGYERSRTFQRNFGWFPSTYRHNRTLDL